MKEIILKELIKVGSIEMINLFDDTYKDEKYIMIHIITKNGSGSAVHTARGDIKTFANYDSAIRFIKKCGWLNSINVINK